MVKNKDQKIRDARPGEPSHAEQAADARRLLAQNPSWERPGDHEHIADLEQAAKDGR